MVFVCPPVSFQIEQPPTRTRRQPGHKRTRRQPGHTRTRRQPGHTRARRQPCHTTWMGIRVNLLYAFRVPNPSPGKVGGFALSFAGNLGVNNVTTAAFSTTKSRRMRVPMAN
ncbi:hypothetical protein CC80DRAFT_235424 [Byssothecium circinans]|uniref:Uncharacterized protein n=1 Tax=Byssothecium circinans TaxID=147558 RepID=A0A6A5UJR3_9PLEO|nr:hypothetical protein CC80DRAFT_235424 [Byssothecium circinans]